MPLIHGKSQKAFEKNIKTEMEHGKPMKQSLAIAYAVKRKAAHKKAKGGYMEAEKTEAHENLMEHEAKESAAHEAMEHKAHGGFIGSHQSPKQPHYDADFADMDHDKEEMASGFVEHPGNVVKHNAPASHEDSRKLNQHGAHEEGPAGAYAKGGFIGSHQGPEHEMDMVGRIMAKRMHHYSHGGVVANDTDMDYAKKEPAEYDYLVKQGGDSFHYTGANSGDELSTAGEMERKEAMLRKIMASRAKKDKMPYYP